jgi:hypothetical protein
VRNLGLVAGGLGIVKTVAPKSDLRCFLRGVQAVPALPLPRFLIHLTWVSRVMCARAACWLGSLVTLHQVSPESPAIFDLLQNIFAHAPVSVFRAAVLQGAPP